MTFDLLLFLLFIVVYFCLRRTFIGWVPQKEQPLFDAIGMMYNLPNIRAKIDSASCRKLADKFTKVTIICSHLWNSLSLNSLTSLLFIFVYIMNFL